MNGMLLSEDELLLRNTVSEFAGRELSVRAADYAVPFENRIGGEEEGFRQTIRVLGSSGIAIAAQCLGIVRRQSMGPPSATPNRGRLSVGISPTHRPSNSLW